MDNYSKVLTFFMENNISLSDRQIKALQEQFLDEGCCDTDKNCNKNTEDLDPNDREDQNKMIKMELEAEEKRNKK